MKRILPALAALLWLLAAPALARDTVYYYYTDNLHSAVVETDAQGKVLERTHYAPYGQVLNRDMRDGPGYTGHQEDPGTGLNYMQQRYYDPEAGRFLSVDPVQADDKGGSFNRYWYANGNPYRYMDPTGMCVGTHICNDDGTTKSNRTFTTKPLAGDALAARIATSQSRLDQASNYLQRHKNDVSGSYSDPGKAASAFGNTFAKMSGKLGVEFAANILSELGGGKMAYSLTDFSVSTDFIKGGPYAGLAAGVAVAGRPGDPSHWGWVHTHWAKDGGFSPSDINFSINHRINAYVFFPDQTSQSFNYSKYAKNFGEDPSYVYQHQNQFSF